MGGEFKYCIISLTTFEVGSSAYNTLKESMKKDCKNFQSPLHSCTVTMKSNTFQIRISTFLDLENTFKPKTTKYK